MASVWDKFSDPADSAPSAWDKFSDPVKQGNWRQVRGASGGPSTTLPTQAQAPDYSAAFAPKPPSVGRQNLGILDASLTATANAVPAFTGSAAAFLASAFGRDPAAAERRFGVEAWGAQPLTEAGREASERIGQGASKLFGPIMRGAQIVDEVTGLPVSDAARHTLTLAAGVPVGRALAPGVTAAKESVQTGARGAVEAGKRRFAPITAEQTLQRQIGTTGSQGAAAATPDLTGASQQLKKAVVSTGRRGEVNTEVLRRHQDAETLPVPVRLLEGEATGDEVLISRDRNLRGQSPELARHMGDTNRALGENLEWMRDRVGEDVFSTNAVEHGQALTSAYQAMDDAATAQIGAAYKALQEAAGGRFPIGAGTLLKNIDAGLKKELKTHYAPAGEMAMLREWAAKPGSMTFEDFEALRTNLATIQRTSADGNARRAAGIMREKLEELPLLPGAERLKGIADQARSLARNRFKAIESDPAYKAVVEDGIKPGDFVQKFLVGGAKDPAAVIRMMEAIPEARPTIATALVNYLQDQAKVGPGMTGNFAAEGYNRALRRIDPIAKYVFTADQLETLEKLGRVARYTTVQPRGSFVNNSNTFVSAAASGVGKVLEGVLNTGGTGLGTAAKEGLKGRNARQTYNRISAPGAGLDYRRQ